MQSHKTFGELVCDQKTVLKNLNIQVQTGTLGHR